MDKKIYTRDEVCDIGCILCKSYDETNNYCMKDTFKEDFIYGWCPWMSLKDGIEEEKVPEFHF